MPTDLRTNQGHAAARAGRRVARQQRQAVRRAPVAVRNVHRAAPTIRRTAKRAPQRVGVFAHRATSPLQHLAVAQHRAAKKTQRARQRMPDVQRANRNITRLVQRENPQYRRQVHRTLGELLTTRAVPAKARGKRQPRLRILPLQTLPSGLKVFGNHPFAAYVAEGINRINVTPDAVHGVFDRTPASSRSRRAYYRGTPIHEFAHTLQHRGLSDAASEGGAEAWAEIAAHDIGMPYVMAPEYAKWAAQVRRYRPWVLRGQFGAD